MGGVEKKSNIKDNVVGTDFGSIHMKSFEKIKMVMAEKNTTYSSTLLWKKIIVIWKSCIDHWYKRSLEIDKPFLYHLLCSFLLIPEQ